MTTTGTDPIDGHRLQWLGESDPVALGIMQGFPPPPDKRVGKANGMQFPNLRWGFRHARERNPTACVRRGPAAVPLPQGPALEIDALAFDAGGLDMSFGQYFKRACVDGFLVLHQGRVVAERYPDSMQRHEPHLWASMAKNVISLLALLLVDEGVLQLRRPLATWVPELAGTPIGEATLQQNLDMEVAVGWPAALPPDIGLFAAIGTIPRPEGAPASIAEYVQYCQQRVPFEHGQCWYYQNGSAEAVAWAIRRATGQRLGSLFSQRVWSRLGAEQDGDWVVDETGAEFASGGLCTTLRDLGRFAELVRCRGVACDEQVVPTRVIDALMTPVDNRARFATGHLAAGRPGYRYRNYFYHLHDAQGSWQAVGRFGQWIHVDPLRELTIVQFGTRPDMAARPLSPQRADALPELPVPDFEARWLGHMAQSIHRALVGA